MSIKENVKSFFKDNIRIAICLISLLLCAFHIYQFFLLNNYICLFRVGMYALLTITVLMFSMKVMYLLLIGLSLLASYFNHFLNFTAFFVLLLACRMYRKSEKWLLVIYFVNESIALIIQNREIIDLLVHFSTCAFFYFVYFFLNRPKILNLKEDEEAIIKQLAEGKLQKEIDLYSKNIIKDKLDHAKDRNHIMSTDELVTLYKQSHIQSHT